MAAGFKGELPCFQTGVTMEISRLDAWYSNITLSRAFVVGVVFPKSFFVVCNGEAAVNSDDAPNVNEQQEKGAHGGLCSTLFIANLGPNCTEIELKEASSVYHGFCMVKMRSRGGVPVAFADFMETEQATKAMREL